MLSLADSVPGKGFLSTFVSFMGAEGMRTPVSPLLLRILILSQGFRPYGLTETYLYPKDSSCRHHHTGNL